ncbi:MAG TPA: addiction module protein [Nitrospiraceae bacterium]|nr:addiction module protein [Nitrospiraceae bacterium]
MSLEKLEAEALKLDPKERARLAGKLLESLEQLSEEESARLWAEEAQRRDEEMDAHPSGSSSAEEALRDARAKLR